MSSAAAQQVVVAPAVHERQGLRRVEVVVERGLERGPVAARLARRSEDVPERLDLRLRLLEHLVVEVHRLAPVRGHEEEEQRPLSPTCRARCGARCRSRATSTSSRRRGRASRCASRCARTRGRARSTARARSRGAGRRGRARRRGSRTPARTRPPPSPSTRCASPAGRGPTARPTHVSSPGLFAFQSAKSRGSSFSGFGSCSSTWSGRWPDSRPYWGSLATRK